ncbi:hypothetical protein SLEP1_g24002 [Rubroshorea leprosula]|uniref:Uncharacterized protein n=1 Tax=Rubroshorea leprosula TaxID=152421 RepID=A0AAV5JEF9_9ROSI|nr:hypothetical protein SLEP1_g24002 [Rubroshorea leprosula]
MASKAYIDTAKLCQNFEGTGVAELLSAMAAGWNSKLIVEAWSHGNPIATSVGLAVAASHTCGRHVCLVPDDRSRSSYMEAMREAGISPTNVVVGDQGKSVAEISGVDFLVMDNSKCKDIVRVLRLSQEGAVLACKNACERRNSRFRWNWVLDRRTHVMRSVFLPLEKGLDIAYVGANGGDGASDEGPSRWIKHIDPRSGEEHIFRR